MNINLNSTAQTSSTPTEFSYKPNWELPKPAKQSWFQTFEAIKNKFSINAKFSDNNTLLVRMGESGSVVGVLYCLARGAEVNPTNGSYSPLYWTVDAAELKNKSYEQITRLLLYYGADVNSQKGSNDGAALHAAAKYGNAKLAKILIDHGADVNLKKDSYYISPLYMAANMLGYHNDLKEHPYVIQLLLKHGAKVNVQNNFGFTPLNRIIQDHVKEEVEHNISSYYPDEFDAQFHTEFHRRNFIYKPMRILLLYKADISIKNQRGDSPFSYLYHFYVCRWACGILPNKPLFDEFILGLDINQLKSVKQFILNDIRSPNEPKYYDQKNPIPEDKKELYISNLKILVKKINHTLNLIQYNFNKTPDPRMTTLNIIASKKGFNLPPEIMNKIKEYDFDFSLDRVQHMQGKTPLKPLDIKMKNKRNFLQKIFFPILNFIVSVCKFILNFF